MISLSGLHLSDRIDIKRRRVDLAEIVFSDHLANGSGFTQWFAENLASVLSDATNTNPPETSFMGGLIATSHRSRCDSSCYDCLRQYRNMNYHGLLDWRLGLATVRMLASDTTRCGIDGNFALPEVDGWLAWTRVLRDAFVLSFAGTSRDFADLPGCVFGSKQVIFVHPLWDCERPSQLLADAISAADQTREIRFLDTFNVVRRPSFAYQALR